MFLASHGDGLQIPVLYAVSVGAGGRSEDLGSWALLLPSFLGRACAHPASPPSLFL